MIIFVGLIPTVIMASTIAEEKENNTLRVLIMSNVKPVEYLCGIGAYLFLLCMMGGILFGVVGEYKGEKFWFFIAMVAIGVFASLMLGAAIGMSVDNQMAANGIAVSIGIIAAFMPMLAGFTASLNDISKFLYTQQIKYLVTDLSFANFTTERLCILVSNLVVFIVFFIVIYRKKGIRA